MLGSVVIQKKSFPKLDAIFSEFAKKEFLALPERKRSDQVNRKLLDLINNEPAPCFLLAAVLEYVERVDQAKILHHYVFNSFEHWLNQAKDVDNYQVRAKIAGKYIDRGDYSALFPVGLGKVYEGTHFVTAHKSPDLDTTVASFWGFLDAFAARVGDGMHVWNVPGGPPSQIEIDWLFKDLFGEAVFTHLPKTRTVLHLDGKDLMKTKGMDTVLLSKSIGDIDHDRDRTAAVLVDEAGFYLGDWRATDVEGVREVILLLSSTLRWFENHLNLQLLELHTKEKLDFSDIEKLYHTTIGQSEPAREFSAKQREKVRLFLERVLKIGKGLDCTFEEFGAFQTGQAVKQAMEKASGTKEIFVGLVKVVKDLHDGIMKIRAKLEKLDVALKTKEDVFGHLPTYVSVRADIDEIKAKMGSYSYLTVNYPDNHKMYPVGIVLASDLHKSTLGTVSLRDFCNREEMGIPSYLEVISVIDHHKSTLSTSTPPFAIISDAQSCNSLVGKQAFLINDRYSLQGQTESSIEKQIAELMGQTTPQATRLLQKLLRRRTIANAKQPFFIHPDREFTEYLHFLYAILEDTDLLTKVTPVDVECIAELLNRLKSLSEKKECELISLDDIPRDKSFAKKAAAKILQNEEMYSLYSKVYSYREKEVEKQMHLAASNKPSNFFADTKEQNGSCRVGQTKMFGSNVPFFEKHAADLRRMWVQAAQAVYKANPDIALHLHMMSTIVSADEVYKGAPAVHPHKDEMWIWIPEGGDAVELLKSFLNSFRSSPGIKDDTLSLEFLGENSNELARLFEENFISIKPKATKGNLPIAILRYKPGALNSRKAMVTPFLPS